MSERVVLIGRHPEYELDLLVVEQRNILWATDFDACRVQWRELCVDVQKTFVESEGIATILLQNVPGILAAVLVSEAKESLMGVRVAVIVQKMQQAGRAAAVSLSQTFETAEQLEAARQLVAHANGRAKIAVDGLTMTVTVDPVNKFELDKIVYL